MVSSIQKLKREGWFTGLWIAVSFMLLSACANDIYRPVGDRNGRPYSSKALVKDLRERYAAKGLPQPYADNDEEYVYPTFHRPDNHRPAPVIPADNDEDVISAPVVGSGGLYTGDADEDVGAGKYPKYDPEEDNSGYYYLPHTKPLPKPVVDEKSGETTYPIYFD